MAVLECLLLAPKTLAHAIVGLLTLGWIGHFCVVVSNRAHNVALLNGRGEEIRRTLAKCQSPCVIEARSLDLDFKWDWLIDPTYAESYVRILAARDGIDKILLVHR